jgi:hypothetical protein
MEMNSRTWLPVFVALLTLSAGCAGILGGESSQPSPTPSDNGSEVGTGVNASSGESGEQGIVERVATKDYSGQAYSAAINTSVTENLTQERVQQLTASKKIAVDENGVVTRYQKGTTTTTYEETVRTTSAQYTAGDTVYYPLELSDEEVSEAPWEKGKRPNELHMNNTLLGAHQRAIETSPNVTVSERRQSEVVLDVVVPTRIYRSVYLGDSPSRNGFAPEGGAVLLTVTADTETAQIQAVNISMVGQLRGPDGAIRANKTMSVEYTHGPVDISLPENKVVSSGESGS